MKPIELMLADYRLTTAEILYHLPDHPTLLQSYLWQEYDIQPQYPILNKFLKFWEDSLDGKLHSVSIAQGDKIAARAFEMPVEFTIH